MLSLACNYALLENDTSTAMHHLKNIFKASKTDTYVNKNTYVSTLSNLIQKSYIEDHPASNALAKIKASIVHPDVLLQEIGIGTEVMIHAIFILLEQILKQWTTRATKYPYSTLVHDKIRSIRIEMRDLRINHPKEFEAVFQYRKDFETEERKNKMEQRKRQQEQQGPPGRGQQEQQGPPGRGQGGPPGRGQGGPPGRGQGGPRQRGPGQGRIPLAYDGDVFGTEQQQQQQQQQEEKSLQQQGQRRSGVVLDVKSRLLDADVAFVESLQSIPEESEELEREIRIAETLRLELEASTLGSDKDMDDGMDDDDFDDDMLF